jgi:hypothetical protein
MQYINNEHIQLLGASAKNPTAQIAHLVFYRHESQH